MAEIKKPLHKFTGDVFVIDENHTHKDILRFLLEDMSPEELVYIAKEVADDERPRNKTAEA